MTTAVEQRLESLLRGEISAAETYHEVLDRLDPDDEASQQAATTLREIQGEHGKAISFFYDELGNRGVEPPRGSGLWGHFAKTVGKGAILLGDKVALRALREGEREGLMDYHNAIEAGELPPACQQYVERERIPAQRDHIAKLDSLIADSNV